MESFSGEGKNDVSTSSERAGFRGMIGQVSFLFYLPSLVRLNSTSAFSFTFTQWDQNVYEIVIQFKQTCLNYFSRYFLICHNIYDWKCKSLTKGDFRVEFTKTQKLLSKLPSYNVCYEKFVTHMLLYYSLTLYCIQ